MSDLMKPEDFVEQFLYPAWNVDDRVVDVEPRMEAGTVVVTLAGGQTFEVTVTPTA